MPKIKDLTGQRFGRLTVISRAENKGRRTCWHCHCDCNNEVTVTSCELLKGDTKSCGCLRSETTKKRLIKHGLRQSKIYRVWSNIKTRCFNLANARYKDYGGRGITMFSAWINDFQAFYDYVSTLPHFDKEGYTLDRIDNNGNYEPGNLRWINKKSQNRNKRNNIIVEYNGVEMCLKVAAEKSGINYGTLQNRRRAGDKGERLFRPVKKSN